MASVSKIQIGLIEEEPIYRFVLKNSSGNSISVINSGCTITSWLVKDRAGNARDIVLGYENLEGYINDTAYIGCVVGRYANRIADGAFSLNGSQYKLACNNGPNHLHGGVEGFNKAVWQAEIIDDKILSLKYLSKDGEEGYPGNLSVEVRYTYSDLDELIIEYFAETEQATPINLTNHAYFNLLGRKQNNIKEHYLQINADAYTALNNNQIPTGEIIPVQNSVYDLRKFDLLGARMLAAGGGFDQNFVINKGSDQLAFAAILSDPEQEMNMKVFTTEPGMQLYTAAFEEKSESGNDTIEYSTVCLETQHYPDSPNHANFPTSILMPGEKFYSKTVYQVVI